MSQRVAQAARGERFYDKTLELSCVLAYVVNKSGALTYLRCFEDYLARLTKTI